MSTNSRLRAAGLCLIVCGAILLRAAGLGYGLPAVYNPDEVAILNRALAFSSGDLNPHNFVYPTLYFYVLFVWEGLWFLAGRAAGVYQSLAAFERSFFVDPSLIYLAGRTLTVVCGVLTVWAVERLGTRLFDRTTGIVAALLLAVAPLAVRDAHYIKHDVPVTLLIVLTCLVLAHLLTGQTVDRARAWFLPGILAGLALSIHYYGIFAVVPLIVAAVLRTTWSMPHRSPHISARLAWAAAGCLLAVTATSPFLFLHPIVAAGDMTANRAIVMDRVQTPFGSGSFYLDWLGRDAAGVVSIGLAVAGAGLALATEWRRAALVISLPLVFLIFLAHTVPASRYLNATLPFVALLAGFAVARMSAHGRWGALVGLSLVLMAVVEGATASVRTDQFFRQPDTRTLARNWIEQTWPPGTSVLIQPYSVPLRPSREALIEALTFHLGAPERASVKFQRQLTLEPYPEPAYRLLYLGVGGMDADKIYVDPAAFDREAGLTPLRALAVTHVVLKRYNVQDPALVSLRKALVNEGRLLATFSPYRPDVSLLGQAGVEPFLHNTDARIDASLERPGPIIDIWAVN